MENKTEQPEIADNPAKGVAKETHPTEMEEQEPDQDQKEVLLDDIDIAYIKKNELKVGRQADDINIRLVNLVKEHPCIYNRDHPRYTDANYKYECWDKIANTLKRKRGECKKKFLSLYQKFGNTYVMIRKPELVKQGFPKKKFVYYEEMIFLKKHFELSLVENRVKKLVNSWKKNDRDLAKQKAKALKEQEKRKEEQSKLQLMTSQRPQFQNPKPDFYRRPPENRPSFPQNEIMPRNNIPMPGPSAPQFFQTISTISTTQNFPGPGMMPQVPQPPFRQQDYAEDKPPASNNRENTATDDSHVDFFFKSVAQQVKKSNISDKNFLDLQSTILSALTYKLSYVYDK
uniref:Uncharacterized protein n=1 Tax=Phlebotomus papatasi TaxID=29031 RepID=A0A1B0DLP9_PHLPP